MQSSIINSPCDGNCIIDSTTQLCYGCFRTIDEIIQWPVSSDEQKKVILEKIESRKLSTQKNPKK